MEEWVASPQKGGVAPGRTRRVSGAVRLGVLWLTECAISRDVDAAGPSRGRGDRRAGREPVRHERSAAQGSFHGARYPCARLAHVITFACQQKRSRCGQRVRDHGRSATKADRMLKNKSPSSVSPACEVGSTVRARGGPQVKREHAPVKSAPAQRRHAERIWHPAPFENPQSSLCRWSIKYRCCSRC